MKCFSDGRNGDDIVEPGRLLSGGEQGDVAARCPTWQEAGDCVLPGHCLIIARP